MMVNSSTTPFPEETTDDKLKHFFMCCITLVSVLAIPPNLLLLRVCTQVPPRKGGKRTGLPPSSCLVSRNLPLLLISQIVSHLLISLSAPLDIIYLEQGGRDDLECALFLAIKSVLMLFSVFVVSLQGADKLYRVRNLNKVFLKSHTGKTLMAIAVSVLISASPLMLEVILSGGEPLKDGCQVMPVVVDFTEAIFLLGFVLDFLAFIAVVLMLRRHTQRVAADEGEAISVISASPQVLVSPPLPSVSEVFNEHSDKQAAEAETTCTEVPSTSAADSNDGTAHSRTKPAPVTIQSRSLSNGEVRPLGATVPAIRLDRSPTLQHISVASLQGLSTLHLSPQCFFPPDEASANPSSSHRSVLAATAGSAGSGSETTSEGSGRWSLSRHAGQRIARSLSSLSFKSDQARPMSTSTATQRRLEFAAVAAVKRGALSLVIFLICYIPLMAALLIISLDDPVYETTLLLEGLTLSISYVHALVSPLLVMRVDREWREQSSALLRRWFRRFEMFWRR